MSFELSIDSNALCQQTECYFYLGYLLCGQAVMARTVAGAHQRRSPEEDGPVVPDDDALVCHGGHVGAPRRAGPEDNRHLMQ